MNKKIEKKNWWDYSHTKLYGGAIHVLLNPLLEVTKFCLNLFIFS